MGLGRRPLFLVFFHWFVDSLFNWFREFYAAFGRNAFNGSASAGDYLYIVNSGDTANFNTFFGNSIVPYEDGDINFNGDDAIELFENGQIIDVFGDVNTDGTGQAWEYTDGWAYRNTTGPSTTFVSTEWNYSGTGNLDGVTNSVSTSPYPSTAILSSKSFSKSEENNFSMSLLRGTPNGSNDLNFKLLFF